MLTKQSNQIIAQQPRSIISFVRSQIVSVIATACDFGVMIFFTEVAHLWYLVSVFLGTFTGGLVGFILGRRWAFTSRQGRISHQAYRYFIMWVINILLNLGGVYCLVDFLHLKYILAKAIVAVILSISFNYPMQKYYVFAYQKDSNENTD